MANLTTNYQLIGSSVIGNAGYGNLEVRLYAKYTEQSVANRTSRVYVKIVHYAPEYIQYYSSSETITGDITASKTNAQNTTFNSGETTLIETFKDIQHNTDGTKTILLGGTFTNSFFSNTTTISNVSCVLPTINVKTDCPAVSGNIESTVNINISPASNSFTHSVNIRFGNINQYLNASGNLQASEVKLSGNSLRFTIPSSFYSKFSGSSGIGAIVLNTYSGNTSLGTNSNTLTAYADVNTCKPTISSITIVDQNSTTTALTGDSSRIVRYKSTARITPTIVPSSPNDNNATISTKKVNNITFTGSYYDDTNPSVEQYTITATNSRGSAYTSSTTFTFQETGNVLVPYVIPTLSSFKFKRNLDVGDQMKLTFNGSVFNGYFDEAETTANVVTVKWYVRKLESDNWTLGGTLVENTDYTISNDGAISTSSAINLTNPLTETGLDAGKWDYKSKYYFKIEIYDAIYSISSATPVEFTQYVKIGLPIFEWYRYNGSNYHQINGTETVTERLYVGGNTRLRSALVVDGATTLKEKLNYAQAGREDYAAAGFTYDQYGNMTHKRTTSGDAFSIKANDGTIAFQVYPEQKKALVNGADISNIYSTSETRIGTWIDNKPLYRKTLVYNNATTGDNYIDLSSLNYDFIVIKESSFIKSTFTFSFNRYNTRSTNDIIEAFINNSQKKMVINIGSSWNNIDCYITIQYTKTTD